MTNVEQIILPSGHTEISTRRLLLRLLKRKKSFSSKDANFLGAIFRAFACCKFYGI